MLPLTVLAALLVTATQPVQLAAPGLSAVEVSPEKAVFLSDHLAQQLSQEPGVRCTTPSELNAVIGMERQKEMMGCQTDASCLVELANALGADGLVTGSIGQFQGTWQVNVKVIGSADARPLAQFSGRATSEPELLDLLTLAARRLAVSSRVALGRVSASEATSLRESVRKRELEERSGLRGLAWIPVASGAVLGGAGAFFLVQAQANAAALSGGDGAGGEPPDASLTGARAAAIRDEGWRNQTLGVAGIGLGAAAMITGAVLYFAGGKEPLAEPWVLSGTPGNVFVGGSF